MSVLDKFKQPIDFAAFRDPANWHCVGDGDGVLTPEEIIELFEKLEIDEDGEDEHS